MCLLHAQLALSARSLILGGGEREGEDFVGGVNGSYFLLSLSGPMF